MTLRQALGSLEQQGWIERRRGRSGGNFIREPRIEVDLTGLPGFTEQMRRANVRAGARVVRAGLVDADADVAEGLEAVSGRSRCIEIVRVRSARRQPLALEETYLPAHLFPGLLDHKLTGSLYELMRSAYDLAPDRAVEWLEPEIASARARGAARGRARDGTDAGDPQGVHRSGGRGRVRPRPLPTGPHPHQPADRQWVTRATELRVDLSMTSRPLTRASIGSAHDGPGRTARPGPCACRQTSRIEDLSGGLTNRNLKVTTPDGVFVARLQPAATRVLLDIDREAEAFNTRAAETAGVGAPYVDFRPDLGLLVIGFIEGRTFTDDDLRTPGDAAPGGDRLHARCTPDRASRTTSTCSSASRPICAPASSAASRSPTDYADFAPDFARIQAALAVNPVETVPCNNDLLAGNIVDDGTRLWLIDYEYSGNNDPYFELGNCWTECGLDDDHLPSW